MLVPQTHTHTHTHTHTRILRASVHVQPPRAWLRDCPPHLLSHGYIMDSVTPCWIQSCAKAKAFLRCGFPWLVCRAVGYHPSLCIWILPTPQCWAGLQAGLLLPCRQPPLSLRVTAPHALSVLKPFSGLSLAPAPLLAQEGSSVTVRAIQDSTWTAHPPQCLALC